MRIIRNKNLTKLTTFRLGGDAKYFAAVNSLNDLADAIDIAAKAKIPIIIIGAGSNILVSSERLNAMFVKVHNTKIAMKENGDSCLMTVGSGVIWDDLVKMSVKENLQGIECMSGIPGTVGAAPVQNIGAYGQQLSDVFVCLTAVDLLTGKMFKLDTKKCKFGYRDSVFKNNKRRYVIWSVTIKLNRHSDLILKSIRKEILKKRSSKLEDPSKNPNAGSFFKNPVISKTKFLKLKNEHGDIVGNEIDKNRIKVSAGWLIERAGLKGKQYKGVAVSSKHSLVLINNSGSTDEIIELAEIVRNSIQSKFGVKLENEVEYIQ